MSSPSLIPLAMPRTRAVPEGSREDIVCNVVSFLWWLHLARIRVLVATDRLFSHAGGGGMGPRLALCCTCSEAGSQAMLGIQ